MQRQFLRRYREIIRFSVKKSQEQPQPKCIPQHPYQHAEKVDYKARIVSLLHHTTLFFLFCLSSFTDRLTDSFLSLPSPRRI